MKRTYTTLPYTEYPTTAFDANRATIDHIVLHSTAGTLQAALNTFSSPNTQTSAHYIIDNNGKLWAGLEEYNVGYHSGNYQINQRSIGIEHVDEGATVKRHTDAQYTTSAKLVKDICAFYNIPINSNNIIPHSQVVATACPNGLDVARIIREASGIVSPIEDDCPAKLQQVTEERDRLNKIIEGKDKELSSKDSTIQNLNSTIESKNSQIAGLEAEKKALAEQLLNCQQTSDLHLEQAKKVIELTNLVEAQERSLQSLKEEITLKSQVIGGLQGKWNMIKLPYSKLLKKLLIDRFQ
jgi:hypothetical protein